MYYYAYLTLPGINPDHGKLYLYTFTWNSLTANVAFGTTCSAALLLTGPEAKGKLLAIFPNIQFQNI